MHCCSCQMQYCFNKLLIENCTPLSFGFALGVGVVDNSITGDKAIQLQMQTDFPLVKV